MTDTLALNSTFRISSVAARAAQICLRNLLTILALNVLPSLPTFLILAWTGISSEATSSAYLVSLPLSTILLIFAQGATIHGTVQILRGGSFDMLRAVQAAWWALPVLTGAGLLAGVIIMLGFAALFVPGLMAICVLYLTLPACVIEKTDMVGSLERSAELTNGHRWALFRLVLLTAVPVIIFSAVTGGLSDGSSSSVADVLSEETSTILYSAFTAVLTAICFEQLRQLDGESGSAIAQLRFSNRQT